MSDGGSGDLDVLPQPPHGLVPLAAGSARLVTDADEEVGAAAGGVSHELVLMHRDNRPFCCTPCLLRRKTSAVWATSMARQTCCASACRCKAMVQPT